MLFKDNTTRGYYMKKIGISIIVLCLVLVFAFFKVPVQSVASSKDEHQTDFVVLSGYRLFRKLSKENQSTDRTS